VPLATDILSSGVVRVFLLPYKVDRPFRMPWITIALIAANVIIFAIAASTGLDRAIAMFGFRPNAAGMVTWLSSMFLHADPFGHLLGNMYFLWLFGSVVEDAIGSLRYLLLYFLGGLGAAVVHALFVLTLMPAARNIPAIGASGAIAAIMGIFAVRLYRSKVKFVWCFMYRFSTASMPSPVAIGLWGGREIIYSALAIGTAGSGVANWAHVGGLLAGVSMALLSGGIRSATAEYMTESASRYATGGTREVAAGMYAELAAKDPTNAVLRLQYARELVQLNPPLAEKAATEYRSGIDLLARGGKAIEAHDAADEAARVLSGSGLTPQSLVAVAGAAESARHLEAAERLYREAAGCGIACAALERARFRLAHVMLALGKTEDARAEWHRFLEAYPSSDFAGFGDRALEPQG